MLGALTIAAVTLPVPDLSLIPTDELLEAVGARFDAYVFAGWQETGTERDDSHIQFAGSPLMLAGLCVQALAEVQAASEAHESD